MRILESIPSTCGRVDGLAKYNFNAETRRLLAPVDNCRGKESADPPRICNIAL